MVCKQAETTKEYSWNSKRMQCSREMERFPRLRKKEKKEQKNAATLLTKILPKWLLVQWEQLLEGEIIQKQAQQLSSMDFASRKELGKSHQFGWIFCAKLSSLLNILFSLDIEGKNWPISANAQTCRAFKRQKTTVKGHISSNFFSQTAFRDYYWLPDKKSFYCLFNIRLRTINFIGLYRLYTDTGKYIQSFLIKASLQFDLFANWGKTTAYTINSKLWMWMDFLS